MAAQTNGDALDDSERYRKALAVIATGLRDEITGLTEMPRRASRRHMMRVAREALDTPPTRGAADPCREALEFYADKGNYVPAGIAPTIWKDNGQRAREALRAADPPQGAV